MDKRSVSSIPLAAAVILLWAGHCLARTSHGGSDNSAATLTAICAADGPRSLILPMLGDAPRAVLELPDGKKVAVEPSIATANASHLFADRLDYQLVLGGSEEPFHISSLGASAEDREDLAYRRLDGIGISCLSKDDIRVYLSFSVNGSTRDFVYVGFRANGEGRPMILGRAIYGALAIHDKDMSRFTIWASSAVTVGNGMGAMHGYQVSEYLWKPDGESVELVGLREASPAYPAHVLGPKECGIRIGDPRVR